MLRCAWRISSRPWSRSLTKKRICIYAGTHGVTSEGVSAYPSEVTGQMVLNFLSGGAAINVLARHGGIEIHIIDTGVDADWPDILLNQAEFLFPLRPERDFRFFSGTGDEPDRVRTGA